MSAQEIETAVQLALAEDIGSGDVTTLAIIPEGASANAIMRAREPLVIAGLAFAEAAFRALAPQVLLLRDVADGQHVPTGKPLLKLTGPARALLSASSSSAALPSIFVERRRARS